MLLAIDTALPVFPFPKELGEGMALEEDVEEEELRELEGLRELEELRGLREPEELPDERGADTLLDALALEPLADVDDAEDKEELTGAAIEKLPDVPKI